MEASGPDLTGLSVRDDSSDACVSSKAVSELLYLPPGRGRLGPTRFHPYDSHAAQPPLSVVLGTFIFGQFSLSSRIFPDFSLLSYSLYIKLLMVALVFRSELAYPGWILCSNICVSTSDIALCQLCDSLFRFQLLLRSLSDGYRARKLIFDLLLLRGSHISLF